MAESVGHGEIRFVGRACVRGCGRPARELGGHCTPCWMVLSARERALYAWEDDTQPTEPLDWLEVLYGLPAVEPRGHAA